VDNAVSCALQKAMLARAGGAGQVVELASSHVPMLSQPKALADVIADAARQIRKAGGRPARVGRCRAASMPRSPAMSAHIDTAAGPQDPLAPPVSMRHPAVFLALFAPFGISRVAMSASRWRSCWTARA
jgi:hypothetical protein